MERIANPIVSNANNATNSSAGASESAAADNANDVEMSLDIKEEKLDEELVSGA